MVEYFSGVIPGTDSVRWFIGSQVYKNGVWRYEKNGGAYNTLSPVIRCMGNGTQLISHIILGYMPRDDDIVHMSVEGMKLTIVKSYAALERVTLECKEGRKRFSDMIIHDAGSDAKQMIDLELNAIGDLELMLKEGIGNYRGQR